MPKYHGWVNINVKTPEKLQKFRRSRAESFVKNCGICSKKEAGEPVSALLIQEEVNWAREVPNRRTILQTVHPKKRVPTEKASLEKEF